MKKKLLILSIVMMFLLTFGFSVQIKAAETNDIKINKKNFPDVNVRQCVRQLDLNKDKKLSKAERKKVKKIQLGEETKYDNWSKGRKLNCKGLEYFYNLKTLNIDIGSNPKAEAGIYNVKYILKLKKLKKLSIWGSFNKTKLDLKSLGNLEELILYKTNLKKVNVTRNKKLKKVDISRNPYIKELNLKNCTKATKIFCEGNSKCSKLILPKKNNIKTLNVAGNAVEKLDVSSLKKLEKLSIIGSHIDTVDVSTNLNLKYLETDVAQKVIKGENQKFQHLTDNLPYDEYVSEVLEWSY